MLNETKDYSCCYSKLSEDDRVIYNCIQKQLISRRKKIYISNAKIGNVRRVIRAIINDFPDFKYEFESYRYIDANPLVILPKYSEKTKEFQMTSQRILDKAKEFAAAVTATDDYNKLLQTYDLIASSITYKNDGTLSCHQIIGPTFSGKGVCDGISKLYKCTMDLLKVPCIIVSNKDHTWNMAYVPIEGNGKSVWRHIDVTWDLTFGTEEGHTYFFLTDKEIYDELNRAKPDNFKLLPRAI